MEVQPTDQKPGDRLLLGTVAACAVVGLLASLLLGDQSGDKLHGNLRTQHSQTRITRNQTYLKAWKCRLPYQDCGKDTVGSRNMVT